MESTGNDLELCHNSSDDNHMQSMDSDNNITNLVEFADAEILEERSANTETYIDYTDLLPDEILEFILSYLPPYKDLESCCLVSKRWCNITKSN